MKNDWDRLLDTDEEIIWQGRPDDKLRFEPGRTKEILTGLVGVTFVWVFVAVSGQPEHVALKSIGYTFVACSYFYYLIGIHFLKAWERRNTHYTLTNKRAFIASKSMIRGSILDSYPIDRSSPITFREARLSSVFFATKMITKGGEARSVPVGLEYLENSRDILEKVRNMQAKLS